MIYTQVVLHLYLPAFQLNVLNVPVVDVKLMKVSRKCSPYKKTIIFVKVLHYVGSLNGFNFLCSTRATTGAQLL